MKSRTSCTGLEHAGPRRPPLLAACTTGGSRMDPPLAAALLCMPTGVAGGDAGHPPPCCARARAAGSTPPPPLAAAQAAAPPCAAAATPGRLHAPLQRDVDHDGATRDGTVTRRRGGHEARPHLSWWSAITDVIPMPAKAPPICSPVACQCWRSDVPPLPPGSRRSVLPAAPGRSQGAAWGECSFQDD